jgi:beta propeller repeat protein
MTTKVETVICDNVSEQRNPIVNDKFVVWQDDRNGEWDIYGYNLSSHTEFPICTNPSDQEGPTVSGDIVVCY